MTNISVFKNIQKLIRKEIDSDAPKTTNRVLIYTAEPKEKPKDLGKLSY